MIPDIILFSEYLDTLSYRVPQYCFINFLHVPDGTEIEDTLSRTLTSSAANKDLLMVFKICCKLIFRQPPLDHHSRPCEGLYSQAIGDEQKVTVPGAFKRMFPYV